MKRIALLVLFFILLLAQSGKAVSLSEEDKSIKTAQRVSEATVIIKPDSQSTGTGFFVGKNTILTNWHVVKMNDTVDIALHSGQKCTGRVGYREEGQDLALLTTDCTGEPLTFTQKAKVGQTVIVVGHPEGMTYTVSKGVVSNLTHYDYVQFDAYVYFGSSGGPITNLDGEVIGVVKRGSADVDRVSWAIPAYRVNQFLERAK